MAYKSPEAQREYMKVYGPAYYAAHKAVILVRSNLRHAAHQEEERIQHAAQYVLHRDEIAARYDANIEEKAAYNAKYYAANREELDAKNREYIKANPEIVSGVRRKHSAKHRTLGFIPLNQPFEGCNGHHVDRERVVYIPEVLHMSIRHNVWNGRNMDKINAAAFDYLSKQEVVA